MQTERMTMARALVRFLNQQYVSIDGIETPFVEGVATILVMATCWASAALEQEPGHLQVMQGCNEQGIAHMATGFAKQHRRQRIFAVTSSVGPGAANMITAAATATANRIPLLLLPGISTPAASRTRCCSRSSSITISASAPTTASARSPATGTASIARSS